jgi:tetratricopeptide (TPR) repeat protein
LVVGLRRWWPSAQPARVALPALGLLMFFYAAQTVRAIPNWHDNQALADYSMRVSPQAALLHVIQALVLQYHNGDWDGAAREYQTALRLNASSVRPLAKVTYDCYIGLGQIALARGQTEEAREYFEKAIRISPNDSPAYDALGAVSFPRGDYARAAEYFSQAVRVNPQDVSAHFYLGTCWMKLGKHREAAEQFRAGREMDPSFRQAYEAEARALEAAGDAAGAARVRALATKAPEE